MNTLSFPPCEWMFFVCLGPHTLGRPYLHTRERAWAHQMLCEGQKTCCCFSCLSDSSALLCLSLRMAFPSAGESSGGPLYPLLCLLENSSICPLRKWSSHSCLSVALLKKHRCPLPSINTRIFMSSGRY